MRKFGKRGEGAGGDKKVEKVGEGGQDKGGNAGVVER